jgi:hypothetical protein
MSILPALPAVIACIGHATYRNDVRSIARRVSYWPLSESPGTATGEDEQGALDLT